MKSTLRWRLDVVDQDEKKTNKLLFEYVQAKRDDLAQINKKNLKLSYEVEELNARILEMKKKKKME